MEEKNCQTLMSGILASRTFVSWTVPQNENAHAQVSLNSSLEAVMKSGTSPRAIFATVN